MLRAPAVSCLLIVLLGLGTFASMGGQRIWHFTDGRNFTAEYQWAGEETIFLKSPDGKEFQLALGALCNDDLAFVRTIAAKLKAEGAISEVPRIWEEFRAKNFTTQEAAKAGYYPLDSRVTSGGSLRLDFRRFGGPAKVPPDQQVVLRMTTARRPDAGTRSQIRVHYGGKIVGATASGLPADHTFDIPLSPVVLMGGDKIILDVKAGSDPVLVRTGKSGAGPRLLVVERKPE